MTWTPASIELITDSRITDREFRLLVYLMAHDLPNGSRKKRKGYAFLSRTTIAKAFGCTPRAISYLLNSLEEKGFLLREIRAGKVSNIWFGNTSKKRFNVTSQSEVSPIALESSPDVLFPSRPLKPAFKGGSEAHFQGTLEAGLHPTLEAEFQGPLKLGFNHKRELNKKREEKKNTTALTPPKKRETESKAFEKAKTEIESLDLTPYRTKYAWLDIDHEHEQFTNHHLSKKANYHGAKKITHWGLAFHNWCNAPWKKPSDKNPKPKKARWEDAF